MKQFTKRTKILLGVFVAIAVLGLSVLVDRTRELDQILENTKIEVLKTSSPAPVKKPVVSPSAKSSAEMYTNLVKEYDGRRIQFDMNCQAIPSNVTYKTGTKVMFDNRSGDARMIKVGDLVYSVVGYGYKILTLTSPSLPNNILLSCGSAVNVGQILLQK